MGLLADRSAGGMGLLGLPGSAGSALPYVSTPCIDCDHDPCTWVTCYPTPAVLCDTKRTHYYQTLRATNRIYHTQATSSAQTFGTVLTLEMEHCREAHGEEDASHKPH